jgi:hypothetical protein
LNEPDRIARGPPFTRHSVVSMTSQARFAERSGSAAARTAVRCNRLLVRRPQPATTASAQPYQVCTCHMCSSGSLLPELLREPDENSFGAPDVAEPIRVFVLDHLADELRAAFGETGERIVDVLHGEHDA